MPTLQEPHSIITAIPELENEPSADVFVQSSSFVILAVGVLLLVILVGVAVIWWVRRSRRAQQAPPSPLDTALAHLRDLEQQLPPLRECGLQVSLIIRRFLQGEVQDPALFETHEEFSRRLDSLASVPEVCRNDTRLLLERLADLKYAGISDQDPVQARALIEQAAALLRRIQEARRPDATTTPTAA